MFGPPDDMGRVAKLHACKACWNRLLLALARRDGAARARAARTAPDTGEDET